MATYDFKHVKNIALLGHAGCGKTTLAGFNMYFNSYAPVAYEVQRKLMEAHSKHEVLQD